MRFSECLVSPFCSKKGVSPLLLENKKHVTCRLVGGYGRTPVDLTILSEESKLKMTGSGPCLTIAEIPVIYGKDFVYEIHKIFHPAVLHPREKSSMIMDSMLTKNSK